MRWLGLSGLRKKDSGPKGPNIRSESFRGLKASAPSVARNGCCGADLLVEAEGAVWQRLIDDDIFVIADA